MEIDQDALLAKAKALPDRKLVIWLATRSQRELNALACTELIDRVSKIINTQPEMVAYSEKFNRRRRRENDRRWEQKIHGAIVPGTEDKAVTRVDLDNLNKEG